MRRALIVGIDDYPATPLGGCVNDAKAIETGSGNGWRWVSKLRRPTPDLATRQDHESDSTGSDRASFCDRMRDRIALLFGSWIREER